MVTRLLRLLAVTGLLLVPAVAGAQQGTLTDLAGGACTLSPRNDIAFDPDAPPPLNLFCGGAKRPSGTITAIVAPLSLPAAQADRRSALEKAAASSAAGRDASTRLTCRAGTWVQTADKVDMLLRPCALADGDWPQLVAIAQLGRFLVQAEGLPVTMPVLQNVMALLTEYLPADGAPALGGPAGARSLLDNVYDGNPSMVTGLDLERFLNFTEEARLDNSRSDYKAAEDAYRQALAIQEKALGSEAFGLGGTLMELALEVSNQGRFDESASLFRRAEPIVLKSPNVKDQARFYTYQSFDSANGGKFQDALNYAREAASLWRDLAEGKSTNIDDLTGENEGKSVLRGELAHCLNTQAAMALRVGELAEAETSAKEALEIIGSEKGLPPWWQPEVLTTLGQIYARNGRLNEAEQSFRGALVFQQRMFGETAPTAATLLLLGGVYADEGLYGDALRAYQVGLGIIEKDQVARQQLQFDQLAPMLTAATQLAAKLPEKKAEYSALMFRSLQFMASGLADQTISQASLRMAATNPTMEALVRGVQDAERDRDAARLELAHETSLPDEERGSEKEDGLLKRITQQTELREALLAKIKDDYPDYANLSAPGVIELPDLQKRLQPGEAMVLFEIGRERSFAIVVSDTGFDARPLDMDQERLDSAIKTLRKAFTVQQGRIGEFDLAEAHALYRALFGPIEGDLAKIDRLVVVPSGSLASLPIALLVTSKPAGQDYRHAAWLVRRFATSQTPSVQAFAMLRDRGSQGHARWPFLGIGNPVFGGAADAAKGKTALDLLGRQCRGDGPVDPSFLRALAPLPETAGELVAVANAVGASADNLLTGQYATEPMVRQQPLDQVRILYFATHGLLPGELSCQSEPALALTPPAAPVANRGEDGLLDASEIAELKLNADLVVLSACNTGQSGDKMGGESLSGLAEAFFYAGARTLLASHGQVPSTATVKLRVGMFQRLGPDLAGGAAPSLRQSQLALIDQDATAHPFFWAAFTLIGDGQQSGVAAKVSLHEGR